MSTREPVDARLEPFYAEERRAPPVPSPEVRARVLEAVLARIEVGGGGSNGPNEPAAQVNASPSPASPIGTFAAGALVGLGLGVAMSLPWKSAPDSPPNEASPEQVRAIAVDEPEPSPAPISVDASLSLDATSLDATTITSTPRTHRRAPAIVDSTPTPEAEEVARSSTSTAEERSLIDRARAALRRGDPHEALVTLMGHDRRFPEGLLDEERDRLIVECLIAQGRHAAARTRIHAYLREHPAGTHRDDLERMERALPQ